jgi:hypothetical protein
VCVRVGRGQRGWRGETRVHSGGLEKGRRQYGVPQQEGHKLWARARAGRREPGMEPPGCCTRAATYAAPQRHAGGVPLGFGRQVMELRGGWGVAWRVSIQVRSPSRVYCPTSRTPLPQGGEPLAPVACQCQSSQAGARMRFQLVQLPTAVEGAWLWARGCLPP